MLVCLVIVMRAPPHNKGAKPQKRAWDKVIHRARARRRETEGFIRGAGAVAGAGAELLLVSDCYVDCKTTLPPPTARY